MPLGARRSAARHSVDNTRSPRAWSITTGFGVGYNQSVSRQNDGKSPTKKTTTNKKPCRYSRAVIDVNRVIGNCVRKAKEAVVGLTEVKSDARVVADLNVLSPMARLGFARIRMFAHIIERKQTTLLTLLLAAKPKTRLLARGSSS